MKSKKPEVIVEFVNETVDFTEFVEWVLNLKKTPKTKRIKSKIQSVRVCLLCI